MCKTKIRIFYKHGIYETVSLRINESDNAIVQNIFLTMYCKTGVIVNSLVFLDRLISVLSLWLMIHQGAFFIERKQHVHWNTSFSRERPVNHYEIISHKIQSIWIFKWSSCVLARSTTNESTDSGLFLVTTEGLSDRNFIIWNKWLRLPSISSCEVKHKRAK